MATVTAVPLDVRLYAARRSAGLRPPGLAAFGWIPLALTPLPVTRIASQWTPPRIELAQTWCVESFETTGAAAAEPDVAMPPTTAATAMTMAATRRDVRIGPPW